MIRRPPRSTRTDTLFPYTTLFRSEGETVTILADGALHPDRVVAGGAVSLQMPASVAHVGLPYRHPFTSLTLEAAAAAGTAVGTVKRVHALPLVLLHPLGPPIRPSIAQQNAVPLWAAGAALATAVPLFTVRPCVTVQ